jgi:ribosomal protein S18 acetylase RimI-like enzyme
MDLHKPLVTHARALRGRFRDGGARAVLAFFAAGVRAQLRKREGQLVIVKQLSEIAVPLRRGAVRIEPVERSHLAALRELNHERGDFGGDARFAADLDAGHEGFVGFKDGRLVSCYWWVDADKQPHRDMRELGLGIELGPGDVYGYDLYVHKGHRAGGTVNDFLFQIETALHERRYTRLWGYVAADNRTARWTYEARGYEPRWEVERTRVLRRWSNRIVPLEAYTRSA